MKLFSLLLRIYNLKQFFSIPLWTKKKHVLLYDLIWRKETEESDGVVNE